MTSLLMNMITLNKNKFSFYLDVISVKFQVSQRASTISSTKCFCPHIRKLISTNAIVNQSSAIIYYALHIYIKNEAKILRKFTRNKI